MSDFIEDELSIADEQDFGGAALNSETFLSPISELALPPLVTVETTCSIEKVLQKMQEHNIGSVVCIENSKLAGIVTERDFLMKVTGKIKDLQKTNVEEIMTPNPQALMAKDEIAYLLNNMHVGGYRHVPIVNAENEPISIVSIKDVVSWVLDHFPQEIINLTGEPYRGPVNREGA